MTMFLLQKIAETLKGSDKAVASHLDFAKSDTELRAALVKAGLIKLDESSNEDPNIQENQ